MPKKKRIKIKPQGLAKPLEIDVEIDEEKEEPKKKKRKRGISVPCEQCGGESFVFSSKKHKGRYPAFIQGRLRYYRCSDCKNTFKKTVNVNNS